ncbi:amino acid ABC transporter substrate-binding protein [Aliikangiella marina]|uniref:Amino acid ABC transporter substrate-binding protein n=1 Tax=Aliikangiella marina TaxID=1712262 RepID=A0A545T6C0_9GAMM|nr:transporter substrate-binding domain-containing protein [Aliikangiella marina]TQV72777.1 amino acid ABC transporter substrate-binding protein [Aliikangiella marina]
MKRLAIIIFAILNLSCFAKFTFSKESDVKLKVVTELLAPYQTIDKAGNLSGYAVEIVEALLADANITAEIEMFPWARTFKIASEDKNVLIFTLARHPERESHFLWLGQIHQETYTLLKIKQNSAVSINSIDDAKRYAITIPEDSVGDHLLTQLGFTNLERTSGFEQCIKMVLTGRADLVLASDYALRHDMTTPEYTSKNLTVAFEMSGQSSGLYIAMSKDSSPQLVKKLTNSFRRLQAEGLIDSLKSKWKI